MSGNGPVVGGACVAAGGDGSRGRADQHSGGYTRHSKGDTDKIDTIGNRNLGDAASQAGVRRFVLTQHPDTRPDSADTPPRARTALRAGPPPAEAFRSGVSGVAGCGTGWCGRQLILLPGRLLRASDRGLFVGVNAGV